MIKNCVKLICGFMLAALTPNTAQACSKAEEDAFFDKKDDIFWVLRDKESFTNAARVLIAEDGSWKGESPVPEYIKFPQKLTKTDLPCLDRWLSLKGLQCFAIADQKEQPNIDLIVKLLWDLKEADQDSDEDLKKRNLFKLAWLNGKETFCEVDREVNYGHSDLPSEWVETNRDFQMMNSHYPPKNGFQASASRSVETN